MNHFPASSFSPIVHRSGDVVQQPRIVGVLDEVITELLEIGRRSPRRPEPVFRRPKLNEPESLQDRRIVDHDSFVDPVPVPKALAHDPDRGGRRLLVLDDDRVGRLLSVPDRLPEPVAVLEEKRIVDHHVVASRKPGLRLLEHDVSVVAKVGKGTLEDRSFVRRRFLQKDLERVVRASRITNAKSSMYGRKDWSVLRISSPLSRTMAVRQMFI
jgi:hypothetical protein